MTSTFRSRIDASDDLRPLVFALRRRHVLAAAETQLEHHDLAVLSTRLLSCRPRFDNGGGWRTRCRSGSMYAVVPDARRESRRRRAGPRDPWFRQATAFSYFAPSCSREHYDRPSAAARVGAQRSDKVCDKFLFPTSSITIQYDQAPGLALENGSSRYSRLFIRPEDQRRHGDHQG